MRASQPREEGTEAAPSRGPPLRALAAIRKAGTAGHGLTQHSCHRQDEELEQSVLLLVGQPEKP